MLSPKDMDLLCKVGPGTPMGELMRRYWLPVAYGWELPRDGQPLRVRLLGEDLLAWRDTNGAAAFVQDRCPHRGAGLYFGRNEEGGIRCAYHGWKFDVAGNCIDMPNEPAASNFKLKVRITAYRGADFGGMTWIYMGQDQDDAPGIPEFEWGFVPENQLRHSHKLVYECNWMQALEGELDTTHLYFLHSRLNPEDSPKYGVYLKERSAGFHIVSTDAGLTYGASRREEDGGNYWRMTNFLFPFYGMFPGAEDGTTPTLHLCADRRHPHAASRPAVASIPTAPQHRQRAHVERAIVRPGRALPGHGPDEAGAEGTVLLPLVAGGGARQRFPDGSRGEADAQRHRHPVGAPPGRRRHLQHGGDYGPDPRTSRDRRRHNHQGAPYADRSRARPPRPRRHAARRRVSRGLSRPVPSRPPCRGTPTGKRRWRTGATRGLSSTLAPPPNAPSRSAGSGTRKWVEWR